MIELDADAIAALDLVKFKRRPGLEITAVRLDLKTNGFTYQKWGDVQTCKRGDWLVCSNTGDTYTIDAESFSKTYTGVTPGRFRKIGNVWACQIFEAGTIKTKEGLTHFDPSDFIVFNKEDRTDGYAISAYTFNGLYEPDTGEEPEG